MESYKAKKALTQGLIHLFLIVFTITMLVPFLWMVLTGVYPRFCVNSNEAV